MSSKRCKIHYRKLRRDNSQFPENATLAAKIKEAINTKIDSVKIESSVQHRITDVPRAEGFQRVLNDFVPGDGFIFGNICLFAPGQMQALLQLASNPDHPSLDEIMKAWAIAESKAPDGHEYLHGIAYWLAIGDHFYQIQHTSLQIKAMEEYLTWLLRDQSKVISEDHYVELQAEFDREQIGYDLGDIKYVQIGGLVPETIHTPETTYSPEAAEQEGKIIEFESRESLGDKVLSSWGKAKDIIESILGTVEAEKLISSIPADAALEVVVNIGYRAKKRKFDKEFMGNLAAGLRNAPDGELRIRGRDGEIKGDDARLSSDMNVRKLTENSGLLDFPHTLEQMLEVHRRFLYDGKIVD